MTDQPKPRVSTAAADGVPTAEVPPLVAEAMKKAAVAWVAVGATDAVDATGVVSAGGAVALWCVPLDGALYVISGPGEQTAPGLAEATTARVTLRGDHGGRIVTWPAEVTRVTPGSDAWAAVAAQVAAKRLNSVEPAAELTERWASECVLSRLAPAGAPLAAGVTLPADSLAAPPRPTPAARQTRKPFRLHRVRRR